MSQLRFPPDFLWGVATSAQQIEGGASEGGRGASIWDHFAATAGAIGDGSRPDRTCDSYRLWRDDIDLMRWLGVGAYRFSTSWSRLMPAGTGRPNAQGLDHYDRLVDALLAAGIVPFITLNHWDLPQALQERGGWANRDTARAFVDYAATVVSRLGDRVVHWVTHNEPWCIAHLGHHEGCHAPGHRDPQEALRVGHHLLLSHGWAVPEIRRLAPSAQVGIVLIFSPAHPASGTLDDRDAARRYDGFFNRWYLDPLLRGEYPPDAVSDAIEEGRWPTGKAAFVAAGDLQAIAAPLDFLGVNYYSRTVLAAGTDGRPRAIPQASPEELTEMGWEVYPAGLTEVLLRLTNEYRVPRLYVTENGAAFADPPSQEGRIADPRRVAYLHDHLAAVYAAIAVGAPVRGMFVWSLLDNWEWGHGFEKRFGLYAVDHATSARRPKDSAYWYRDAIAAGAATAGRMP